MDERSVLVSSNLQIVIDHRRSQPHRQSRAEEQRIWVSVITPPKSEEVAEFHAEETVVCARGYIEQGEEGHDVRLEEIVDVHCEVVIHLVAKNEIRYFDDQDQKRRD